MTKQKTFTVKGKKIKIVSRLSNGAVRTNINGEKFFCNQEVMDSENLNELGHGNYEKIWLQKAMDLAYVKWVKKKQSTGTANE